MFTPAHHRTRGHGRGRAAVGPGRVGRPRSAGCSVIWPARHASCFLSRHARASHHPASEAEAASGTKRLDRRGRVRPRGDASHPRGQARRAIGEASDRDRAVEGAPRRREAARTEAGQREDPSRRERGERRRAASPQVASVARPQSRDDPRAPPGAASRGIASRACGAGAQVGGAARSTRALGGRPQGGADQGAEAALGRRAEGGGDSQAPLSLAAYVPAAIRKPRRGGRFHLAHGERLNLTEHG
jgi:hypothetical protein